MPKGGARVNSGPAPDPNALRRDRASDKDGWTLLPAGGRTTPAPAWPLRTNVAQLDADAADSRREVKADVDDREAQVWADAWRSPQAVAWERLGWLHDVALYVRFVVVAERGDLKAAGEVRQWSDRLGLNPAAMLRNRWKIAPDELGARRDATQVRPAGRPSARDRLKTADA
jgi:hypothetical protein